MRVKNYKEFNNLNEKYQHTEQDKKDDIRLIKEFSEKLEEKFGDKLNLEIYKNIEFRDYLGYGANKIYHVENLNVENKEFEFIDDNGMLWIETGINPHGVTGENDIDRTYVIKFQLMGSIENKHYNELDRTSVLQFYKYGITMESVMEHFENYLKEKNLI